jgi:hypothetical protein
MLTALAIVASMALSAPHVYVAPISGVQQSGSSMPFEPAINFTGSSVSCVDDPANSRITCTVSGGSGSANTVLVTVDFGSGNTSASTVVTGQTWVSASSVVSCTPTLFAATGRDEGAEDAIIESVTGGISTRVAGTGFKLTASKPGPGQVYGSFIFACTGA